MKDSFCGGLRLKAGLGLVSVRIDCWCHGRQWHQTTLPPSVPPKTLTTKHQLPYHILLYAASQIPDSHLWVGRLWVRHLWVRQRFESVFFTHNLSAYKSMNHMQLAGERDVHRSLIDDAYSSPPPPSNLAHWHLLFLICWHLGLQLHRSCERTRHCYFTDLCKSTEAVQSVMQLHTRDIILCCIESVPEALDPVFNWILFTMIERFTGVAQKLSWKSFSNCFETSSFFSFFSSFYLTR